MRTWETGDAVPADAGRGRRRRARRRRSRHSGSCAATTSVRERLAALEDPRWVSAPSSRSSVPASSRAWRSRRRSRWRSTCGCLPRRPDDSAAAGRSRRRSSATTARWTTCGASPRPPTSSRSTTSCPTPSTWRRSPPTATCCARAVGEALRPGQVAPAQRAAAQRGFPVPAFADVAERGRRRGLRRGARLAGGAQGAPGRLRRPRGVRRRRRSRGRDGARDRPRRPAVAEAMVPLCARSRCSSPAGRRARPSPGR